MRTSSRPVLALLSLTALLAGRAAAQCLTAGGGAPAPLAAYTTYPLHDEGRTAPIDLQFGPNGFPMAGSIAALTHVVVETNGVLYLTDGSAPNGTWNYGPQDLFTLRGFAGDAPRVFPLWHDLQGPAATWSVRIDQSVPGRCDVWWQDVQAFASNGPVFSFRASLFDTGAVEFAYSALPGLPIDPILSAFSGISLGNGVGTGFETSVDLTAGPDSGTLGLLFEQHLGAVPGLGGKTVLLTPNGNGGYTAVVACASASHVPFGVGCYETVSTFYALFADAPAAKAALDGNGLVFQRAANGYLPTFVPGYAAAFVPPSGAAIPLALGDDGNAAITTSSPVPIPGGATSDWNVSANGILTAAATANNPLDYQPSPADVVGAAAPRLAFYCWHDFNLAEAGSGPIVHEEVGGRLCVTWNGVECYGAPSPNPATWQFQVDLASGDVHVVWVAMDPATTAALSGDDTLIGCTLAGPGPDAGARSLGSVLPGIGPDAPAPMLSAAPPPVINPSTVVDYTITDVPEFVPGSGVRVATVMLSLGELPGGFDLTFLGAPGCAAYVGSLDLDLGGQVSLAPTATFPVTLSNLFFAPGDTFAVQAIALVLPNSLPNGGNAAGIVVSNALRTTTQPF